jgi:hypothetical protein
MFAGGAPVLKQLLQLFAPLCWFPTLSFGACVCCGCCSPPLPPPPPHTHVSYALSHARVRAAYALSANPTVVAATLDRWRGARRNAAASLWALGWLGNRWDRGHLSVCTDPWCPACACCVPVRYALEALYVGEVVEYKHLFVIQVRRGCG